jgi:hypothetical protein
LQSRRALCYNTIITYESRRVMYDDYDFDYTYTNDYADLDEYSQDLDEDYARDGQDYESSCISSLRLIQYTRDTHTYDDCTETS